MAHGTLAEGLLRALPAVVLPMVASAAGALRWPACAHAEVDRVTGESTSAESKSPALAAYARAKLFRNDPYGVEKSRKVFLLLGITGAGKSATANTMCGAKRAFEAASSVASVTSAVQVRDYSFNGSRWRVVDTPGLGDTHKSREVTEAEIREAFRYARYGIAAVVVIVPKGRITAEMELRVRQALELLGGSEVLPFTIMAVTRSEDSPEKLVDDIMRLPLDHGLRRLCGLLGHRVVPVENIKEPARAVSRLLLHNAIDEVLEMNAEERFMAHSVTLQTPTGLPDVFGQGFPAARCSSVWSLNECRQPRLTVTCDFGIDIRE